MTTLTIYDADTGEKTAFSMDKKTIQKQLQTINVELKYWKCDKEIRTDSSDIEITEAYGHYIKDIKKKFSMKTIDILRVNEKQADPEKRFKFLQEHTHTDPEVRFFVRGGGVFYIHVNQKVYGIFCTQGDLLALPANAKHWFDYGANPDLMVVRFFADEAGWIASYTGDNIANEFPKFDSIQAVVCDIEGTTSSLCFVHDTLFPYAKEHLEEFLTKEAENPAVKAILKTTKKHIKNNQATLPILINTFQQWMAKDEKLTPLKQLQGLIWEKGYQKKHLIGHVFHDAYTKLKAWHKVGIRLYIYSSGSKHAQKLLFQHTAFGDLSMLFSDYFDTTIGNKLEANSYTKIAKNCELNPTHLLFLSDNQIELDAAKKAGWQTIGICRKEENGIEEHRTFASFNGIVVEAE